MKRAAALPMVLMLLGLVGALAVGGAFAARRIVADARRDVRALELRPAVEQAIVQALSSLDSAALASHTPGSTIASGELITPKAVTSWWITSLRPNAVWVVVEASTTTNPLLHNRLGVFAQYAAGGLPAWSTLTWLELP